MQKELTEAMETQRALEGDLDQKGREIRELEVCSMLSIDVLYIVMACSFACKYRTVPLISRHPTISRTIT